MSDFVSVSKQLFPRRSNIIIALLLVLLCCIMIDYFLSFTQGGGRAIGVLLTQLVYIGVLLYFRDRYRRSNPGVFLRHKQFVVVRYGIVGISLLCAGRFAIYEQAILSIMMLIMLYMVNVWLLVYSIYVPRRHDIGEMLFRSLSLPLQGFADVSSTIPIFLV